jgi:hypothetical protein
MSATFNLRFIERDGKKILQQEHFLPVAMDVLRDDPMANEVLRNGWPTEWRDIPLIKEEPQDKRTYEAS